MQAAEISMMEASLMEEDNEAELKEDGNPDPLNESNTYEDDFEVGKSPERAKTFEENRCIEIVECAVSKKSAV